MSQLVRRDLGRPDPVWPLALVAAAAAVGLAQPFSTPLVVAAAALGTVAGCFGGARLARTPLRGWVVVAGAILALGLVFAASRGASALRPPFGLVSAESWAHGRDAATLLVAGALIGTLLAFLPRRARFLRPLPLVLVVLAAIVHLWPHRGGAINRPLIVGDLAYLHGMHPAFLLGLAGALAGLIGSLALLREGGVRRALAVGAVLGLTAAGLLAAYPSLGVFSFSDTDPLSLTSEDGERGPRRARSAGGEGGREDGQQGLRLVGPGGEGRAEGGPDQIPFRDDYSSDGQQVPVAVAVLHDDVEPGNGVYYFRQVAFSNWNGRRLVRSYRERAGEGIFTRFPAGGPITATPPPGRALRRDLPVSMALLRDHYQPPVLVDGVEIAPSPNPDPSMFRRTYSSVSSVLIASPQDLFGYRAGSPAWSAPYRRELLEAPSDPRYASLAQEIRGSLRRAYRNDPWAKALGIAYWLETNTRYSQRSKHATATDPTASFLFGSRVGYCVHLAHAVTYLARSLGVPARVAAGYAYVAEHRGDGSALLIRSGDAHAWSEVYLEGVGWVAVDPSPPTLDPMAPAPDMDLQSLLGELARGGNNPIAESMPDAWQPPTWREILRALALLALSAWIVGVATKLWRALAPRFARPASAARLAHRASLDRLVEAGVVREFGESREAFAARAAAFAPSFAPLSDAVVRTRLARSARPLERAAELADSVRRELVARRGARAWLAYLSPFDWTRSR